MRFGQRFLKTKRIKRTKRAIRGLEGENIALQLRQSGEIESETEPPLGGCSIIIGGYT